MYHNFEKNLKIMNFNTKFSLIEDLPKLENTNITYLPSWFDGDLKTAVIKLLKHLSEKIKNYRFVVYPEFRINNEKPTDSDEENKYEGLHHLEMLKYTKEWNEHHLRKMLLDFFKWVDQLINDLRKKFHCTELKIKTHRRRKICFYEVGKLEVPRTIFKVVINNKTKTLCIFDLFFNFRKRGLFLKGCEHHFISRLNQDASTREIASSFGCSPPTITNNIRRFSYDVKDQIVNENAELVYAAADSFYTKINRKKGRKLEIKSVVLWTGSTDKNKLKDRIIIHLKSNSREKRVEELKNKIATYFPNHKKVFVIGDGAAWIKKLGKDLDGFYLDKFHYINSFYSLFKIFVGSSLKKNKPLFKFIKNKIYSSVKSGAINCIEDFIIETLKEVADCKKTIIQNSTGEVFDLENKEVVERMKTEIRNHQKFGYIKRNQIYFKKTCDSNLINPIEAIQAHYVATSIRKKRSATARWLTLLKLNVSNAIYNNQEIRILINNPIFETEPDESWKSEISNNLKWYTYNKSEMIISPIGEYYGNCWKARKK